MSDLFEIIRSSRRRRACRPLRRSAGSSFRSKGNSGAPHSSVSDMGRLVTDHAVIAAAHRSQRERIRRGSVENEVDVAVRLEKFPNHIRRAGGIPILSIGRAASLVASARAASASWTEPGGVVAGKIVTRLHRAQSSPAKGGPSSRGPSIAEKQNDSLPFRALLFDQIQPPRRSPHP